MAAFVAKSGNLLQIVLAILAGLVVLTALKGKVLAEATHTFVVPIDDGYGLNDCIGKDRSCAEVVAAAWCEVHGYARPTVYGRAADIATGAVSGAPQAGHIDANSFVVTCKG